MVRRSADRYTTRAEGVVSRHCFSAGAHYDPHNVGFGVLLACNDETLAPGAGFDTHAHSGLDIVSWLVSGRLEHTDSAGRLAITSRGQVQVLGSGAGVMHSERNAGVDDCRFVQSWVRASQDEQHRYEQLDVSAALAGGGLTPVVSLPSSAAELHAGVLTAGAMFALPTSPLLHVYVVAGAIDVPGVGLLDQGDSLRVSGESVALSAAAGADGCEVLVWAMPLSTPQFR